MNLTDLIGEQTIELNLAPITKSEAIESLVDIMVKAGKVPPASRAGIIKAVKQREEVMTTGIGSGVALPHAKSKLVPELMLAVARSRKPIEFDAVDGQPTDLFFLLLSREDTTGLHIQALARLARLLRDDGFCQALRKAESPGEVFQIIATQEKTHSLREI
ncbi:MAG: hypothetical protein AMS15_00940 [Planctomycetes bacterium DG_23]|nr:MAG: hypothetical protein AMS15_00940 [Planctomycetes bacterium DG_23]